MNDRLREIVVSVTCRCNLRCAMCEIPKQGLEEMSTEELNYLIADAASLNPNTIVFSGGEPLLREDIFGLISFANSLKINTCLTSNGVLIDEMVAKRLSSSRISVVNISIEGLEEVHDSLRGKGSFLKAVKALENLSSNNIETTIAAIVSRQNYASLPYVMELAHKYKIRTVKFQPFSGIFLVEKDKEKFFLPGFDDLEPLKKVIEKIKNLSREYGIVINPCAYLDNIPYYLCENRFIRPSIGCAAVWHSCPISSDANVYLCWMLNHRPLGNVKVNRLSHIWNSPQHNKARKDALRQGCRGCLMSCYDYNFNEDFLRALSLRIDRFSKPRFYERQYRKAYQHSKYLAKRFFNRISSLKTFFRKNKQAHVKLAEEINSARNILKKKLLILDKNAED